MTNETSAALIGALVGGALSVVATFVADNKRKCELRRGSITLFKYLNQRWEAAEALNGGSASQKKDYLAILVIAERIRETIMRSECSDIIPLFLRYWSAIEEVNMHLQAGNLGLKSYPVSQAREVYVSFRKIGSLTD